MNAVLGTAFSGFCLDGGPVSYADKRTRMKAGPRVRCVHTTQSIEAVLRQSDNQHRASDSRGRAYPFAAYSKQISSHAGILLEPE